MNITILGAAGFIGTNLAIALAKDNHVTVVDQHMDYFSAMKDLKLNVISGKLILRLHLIMTNC